MITRLCVAAHSQNDFYLRAGTAIPYLTLMQIVNPAAFKIAHYPVRHAFATRMHKVFALIGECRTEAEHHSHPPTPAMSAAFDRLMADVGGAVD